MKIGLFVIVALLMTSTVATAQHQHGTQTLIDGRETPELIPDSVAYQNFFLARSLPATNASDEERKHLDYKIHTLGLDTQDELQFRLEMTRYRIKFDNLVASHSRLAEKGLVAADVFNAGAAKLVAETRDLLAKSLSPSGQQQFEDAVLAMRKNTRYITTGGAK